MKIAAILTCFNRKEKTLTCLSSLFKIYPNITVYLTDDGCTDGTPEAIREIFPKVVIVKGNGNLFWSRGMYTAWKEAIKGDYDFYLWLNDDLVLYPNLMDELLYSEEYGRNNCIVTGLLEEIGNKGTIIYGGRYKNKVRIQESDIPQNVFYMNGNIVLVPRGVVNKIGIMDPVLHHDGGDIDYGLTAIENGIKVLTTRKAVGAAYNNIVSYSRLYGTTIKGRFKKLQSPLGSPIKLFFYLHNKHFGLLHAVLSATKLIVINILPDLFFEIPNEEKNKYK